MEKVKSLPELKQLVKKHKDEGKTIVLVTGVFDILHIGHVRFLEKAKSVGDILICALDGDDVVRYLKGGRRPINNEKNRAEVLSNLAGVDLIYIFNTSKKVEFDDWFKVCYILRPDILAVTAGDPLLERKSLALKQVGCQVKVVTPLIENESTTRIAKLLEIE